MENDNSLLSSIIGAQLSTVDFVMDYIQLNFDGDKERATLTTYTLPVIRVGENLYKLGDPGYRDKLVERIAKRVTYTWVKEKDEIGIGFDDGSTVSVSLKPEDCSGPEAFYFSGPNNLAWVL